MSTTPPEDLVVYARQLDRDVMTLVRDPQWADATDWRAHVPTTVQRLWGRLDLETRIAVFVVAQTAAKS